VYGATILALLVLGLETQTANREKNNEYLERLARIVIAYEQANGAVPESFDTALEASAEVLPNRGDADGNPIRYARRGDHAFSVRSLVDERVFVEYEDGKLSSGKKHE
jgi:hypothetical protein